MTDGSQYYSVLKLQETAEKNGFIVKRNYQNPTETLLMLCNRKDTFPHYVADSEFAIGSVEDLRSWLNGWEKAVQYTEVLGFSSEQRDASEQIVHNELLMKLIAKPLHA